MLSPTAITINVSQQEEFPSKEVRQKICGSNRAARLYALLIGFIVILVLTSLISGFVVADLSITKPDICSAANIWIFVFSLTGTILLIGGVAGSIRAYQTNQNPKHQRWFILIQFIGNFFLSCWTIYGLFLLFSEETKTQCKTGLILYGRIQALFYLFLIVIGYLVSGAIN